MTQLSVASILKKALDYATRPLSEFNIFEILEIMETLQNTARDNKHEKGEYYRLVYQTARDKTGLPKEHFRALVLRLLGDKDHQKVFEAVAKIEKAFKPTQSVPVNQYRFQPYRRPQFRDNVPLRCFYCNKLGHIMAKCLLRKSTLQAGTAQEKYNQSSSEQDKPNY